MATFKQRPDGLVDLTLDTGQVLPMTEQQARMGGATPEPTNVPPLAMGLPGTPGGPPLGPGPMAAPGGPLPAPVLGPNPYSMIGSGQATAELPAATARAMSDARSGAINPAAALSPTAPPVKTKEQELDDSVFGGVGDFVSGAGRTLNRWLTRPAGADTPELRERQRKWDETHPDAAPAPAAPAPAPATGAAPAQAAPAPRPTGAPQAEGGYQLNQPIVVSPGGFNLAEQTVRHGVKLDPAAKRAMDALDPEAMRKQRLEGASKQYDEEQLALKAQEVENERQRLDNEDRKQEIANRRALLQERLNTIDKREQEAAQATPQSRGDIVASRSTLAKMMSALSIVMGARYQGLTGRNNPGLDLYNQAINDEIADQRAKYEAAKDRVAAARTSYGQALQLYGDPNLAESDLRLRMLTLGKNIADNHWSRATTEKELATNKAGADDIARLAAKEKQDFATLAQNQQVDTYKREPAQIVSGMLDDKDLARMVHVEGYGNGFVGNPAQQAEIQKRLTAASTALAYFDQLEALQKKGEFMNDLDKRAAIESWKQAALPAMSEAAGQGVVTKTDAENAEQVLNNPNAFFSSGITALLASRNAMRIRMDNVVRDSLFGDPRGRTRLTRQIAPSFKPGLQ